MRFDGMKCILLAALAAPVAFGAVADQGEAKDIAALEARLAACENANKRLNAALQSLDAGSASVSDVVTALKSAMASSGAATAGGNEVAQKLKSCQFMLNGNYKQNAKYYLMLCSASWCGPCRREMPRIAKTYVEKLQADPDIELIHFSYDGKEEKAMAWAKENDVKFPVVKPKGGNPLNLSTRGIPHMFIVRADGKVVAEGHPMDVFTEKKLEELKR